MYGLKIALAITIACALGYLAGRHEERVVANSYPGSIGKASHTIEDGGSAAQSRERATARPPGDTFPSKDNSRTTANAPAPENSNSRAASDVISEYFAASAVEQKSDSTDEHWGHPVLQRHAELTADKPDSNWSPLLESHLRSFMSDSLLPSELELVSVTCGSSICEIQAASTSAADSDKASSDWQTVVENMSLQPWWQTDGFSNAFESLFVSDDGRAMFIVHVKRKPQLQQRSGMLLANQLSKG